MSREGISTATLPRPAQKSLPGSSDTSLGVIVGLVLVLALLAAIVAVKLRRSSSRPNA